MPLHVRLYAFGSLPEAEAVGHLDDGTEERARARVLADGCREALVDLELVDGKVPEMAQGRVTGPEIIDATPDAVCADLFEN